MEQRKDSDEATGVETPARRTNGTVRWAGPGPPGGQTWPEACSGSSSVYPLPPSSLRRQGATCEGAVRLGTGWMI